METATFVDRTGWADGPWADEPDRMEWRDGSLVLLAKRGPLGAWCGYVGVPPGHRWHGVSYNDVEVMVHCGLTYSEGCTGDPPSGICHIARDGEPDEVWWLGFDCAHGSDAIPSGRTFSLPDAEYRDASYVIAEVERLAEQIKEAS